MTISNEQIAGVIVFAIVGLVGWVLRTTDKRITDCREDIDALKTQIALIENDRKHDSTKLDEILRQIQALFQRFDLYKESINDKLSRKQDIHNGHD